MGLFAPLVRYDDLPIDRGNDLLTEWQHKMGPCKRPAGLLQSHALYLGDRIVGLTVTADFVTATCAGYTRAEGIELARVSANEPWVNRILVRLWRETILPGISASRGRPLIGLSYQDAKLHTGDLYRFDGWVKVAFSHSGVDRRSGRSGRDKYIWAWPPNLVRATPTQEHPHG